jgi:hypothetical protein
MCKDTIAMDFLFLLHQTAPTIIAITRAETERRTTAIRPEEDPWGKVNIRNY